MINYFQGPQYANIPIQPEYILFLWGRGGNRGGGWMAMENIPFICSALSLWMQDFSKYEGLHVWRMVIYSKIKYVLPFHIFLPETDMAPENRSSPPKKNIFQPVIFKCYSMF